MIVLCVVMLTDRCARTYTHSFYFQSEHSQNRSSKRVAMGVSSCSVIGDFWPVVHRESRILLVVHRARHMVVIRES